MTTVKGALVAPANGEEVATSTQLTQGPVRWRSPKVATPPVAFIEVVPASAVPGRAPLSVRVTRPVKPVAGAPLVSYAVTAAPKPPPTISNDGGCTVNCSAVAGGGGGVIGAQVTSKVVEAVPPAVTVTERGSAPATVQLAA